MTDRNSYDSEMYASNDLYKNYFTNAEHRIITMDANEAESLTAEDVKNLVEQHQKLIPFYKSMEKLYKGLHPIFYKKNKTQGKPDVRIAVNFARYLVDTSSSYFNGKPMRFNSTDIELTKWLNDYRHANSEDDLDSELSKNTAIYGHAYKYLYQDEDAKTRVAVVKPTDAFIVYSDDVRRIPILGVVYEHIDDQSYRAGVYTYNNNDKLVFTKQGEDNYKLEEDDTSKEQISNPYDGVPLVEFMENKERQGRIEMVTSLINAYNEAISEKADDVAYFADAYLKLIGVDLGDNETLKQLRDNRVIWTPNGTNTENKIDIGFLEKPNADTTQENLLNRLERLIYKTAMVFNTNDESFSGNISGEALRLKLRDMDSVAGMKARKFETAYLQEYKKIMGVETNGISDKANEWETITITPMFNEPHNISTEADTMAKLTGITSQRTQLSQFSPISNVDDEIKQIEQEKKQAQDEIEKSYPTLDANKQADDADAVNEEDDGIGKDEQSKDNE